MKIAHLSAEVSPFAKTGGLGDVVGALPTAQAQLGHEVSVWMPLYRDVWQSLAKRNATPEVVLDPFRVLGSEVGILRTTLAGSSVPLYLIGSDPHFNRPQIYSPDVFGSDDGLIRYAIFVRAALEAMRRLWKTPDILHAHDWHTALAPMILAWDPNKDWPFNATRSVLTVHNMAYQGWYSPSQFPYLQLPSRFLPVIQNGGVLNLMKGALLSSNLITAVSPTFAREIMTPDGAFGLDGVVRMRGNDLVGIVNGIDPAVWNPRTDNKIPSNYDGDSLGLKLANRAALLRLAGMDPSDGGMVVGLVGRLTEQKGYDLLFPVLWDLIAQGIRFVFLGSGESQLEQSIHYFSREARGRFWGYVGFQDDLSHLIEAGADTFLMPSRFEPCGLNQMYSLAYGTPPIVRSVGGLADTVVGYNAWNRDTATGFSFDAATPSALRDTVLWARSCYNDPRLWTQIIANGMRQDFTWTRSAHQYIDAYKRALA